MKILFFGTPAFASPFLQTLIDDEGIDVLGVVTQPDKPVGRKQILTPSPIRVLAETNNLPVETPVSLKNPDAVEALRAYEADYFVVVAYGKIIPQAILDLPKRGSLNVHPSLLPAYRGPSPMQWALMNGDKKTGVTIMLLDAGMDTGDLLSQVEIELDGTETYPDLQAKVHAVGPTLLRETLHQFDQGMIKGTPQNDAEATHTKLLSKEDGRVDWNQSAKEIEQRFRAFQPWPGLWTTIDDPSSTRIVLKRIECSSIDGAPGHVFLTDDGVHVGTKNGSLLLHELQPEGRRSMSVSEFLAGNARIIGTQLR